MAEYDMTTPEVAEHARGNFAGIGSLVFPKHILAGEQERRGSAERSPGGLQSREGWSDDEINGGTGWERFRQVTNEDQGLGGGLVHFPVADDENSTHRVFARINVTKRAYGARSGNAARPGSCLPSSSSKAAPPPVEINEILSDSPARWTASAVSPPPTIVSA